MYNRGSRSTKGLSPTLGVIILVVISLALSAVIAPFVYEAVQKEEDPEGVGVTFEESREGSVTVRIVDMGTADNVTVYTDYLERTVTEPGTELTVYPGEGEISIIANQDGRRNIAQSYVPKWGPDDPLGAVVTGDLKKYPGQDYTLDASDSVGSITEYRWDFDGDGTTDATGKTATVNWTRPGIYEPKLTVVDAAGNTHSTTVSITNTHLTVAQDGTGDYKRIQWAVDNASSGWSIYVKDTGAYEEQVEVNRPSLTIFSNEYATLDGKYMSDSRPGLEVTETDIEIRGIRLRRYGNGTAVTVNRTADNAFLHDIYVDESGDPTVDTGAVHIERGASNVEIVESRFLSNTGTCAVVLGDDSYTGGGPSVTIDDSAVRSTAGHGLCAYDSVADLSVTNSAFSFNNKTGASLGDGDSMVISQSIFNRNGISESSTDSALLISESVDTRIAQVSVKNNFDGGLTTRNNPYNFTIIQSDFLYNAGDGVIVDGVNESQFTNINSSYNTGIGLNILGDSNNITVNKSELNGNTQNGLFLNNKNQDISLGELLIRKNTEHGVYIDRANGVYIENANFTDNGGNSGEYHGAYIRGTTGSDEDIVFRYSHFYGTNQSEEDIVAGPSAKSIDARYNWWGENSSPTENQYAGDINFDPICENSDCTSFRYVVGGYDYNDNITAVSNKAGDTTTHIVKLNVTGAAVGNSLNQVDIDYKQGETDASSVPSGGTFDNIQAVGADSDSDGEIETNLEYDLSEIKTSEGGSKLTFVWGGSYSPKEGEMIIIEYGNVDNPPSSGTYGVDINLNGDRIYSEDITID